MQVQHCTPMIDRRLNVRLLLHTAEKVGGTRWKGVRTVIEEPDQKAATSSAPATGAAEECLSLSSIKWRKLATGMLQQVKQD